MEPTYSPGPNSAIPPLWALWRDRKLTASELRELEQYAPRRSRIHACVAAVWLATDLPVHLAHTTYARALEAQGWTLGACDDDAWAPEVAILLRAQAGAYQAYQGTRATVGERLAERQRIRRDLLTHAGWCRWCAHSAFLELAGVPA